jgi:hypothetical protein
MKNVFPFFYLFKFVVACLVETSTVKISAKARFAVPKIQQKICQAT